MSSPPAPETPSISPAAIPVAWVDGVLVPADRPVVAPRDHGLVVGDGAFETMKVVDGVPFARSRHLRRLRRTLDALHIEHPGDELVREALGATIAANAITSGRVRLTITAGTGPFGSGEPDGPAVTMAVAEPLAPPPPPRAVTVPWTRNETGAMAGLKSTSYAENVRALRYAHRLGAGEALLANTRGELCEGTGSNVFVVVDGTVATPPLSSGCLPGVTRALVLECVRDVGGIDVVEAVLPFDVLERADEVFLTSSLRDVQGMAMIDDRPLSSFAPVTEACAAAFAARVAESLDP